MIAASHVLTSKNSSMGSPKPSARARKPPSSAPTIPMITVTMKPPGSSPGSNAFAITPATIPSRIQPRIPMFSPLVRSATC
jgi:hypothetical protein